MADRTAVRLMELIKADQAAVEPTPAAPSPPPVFRGCTVRRTTTQTVPAPGVIVEPPLEYDVADRDEDGMWDPGDPTKLTIPARKGGLWRIDVAHFAVISGAASGYFYTVLVFNGGGHQWNYAEQQFDASYGGTCAGTRTFPDLAPGDYFQVLVGNGVAVHALTIGDIRVTAEWLGP